MKNMWSVIKKGRFPINAWVIAIITLFVVLRIPSLIEPHWYGDEGIYEVIGIALRQGHILYKDIWDNKPPMLYFLYALVHGDLFSIRFLSLFFGIASIVTFYALAKKLFVRSLSQRVSTVLFAILFGLPLLEGNIANAENFMILPILLAMLFLYSFFPRTESKIPYIAAGVFFSVAVLTKVVALFDVAACGIFLIMLMKKEQYSSKQLLSVRKIIVWVGCGFIIPIVSVLIYFSIVGASTDFVKAVLSQNVGYVGVNNFFLFPMGLLVVKTVLLMGALIYIYFIQKSLTKAGLFILIWFALSLFSVFFSDRPYTHYILSGLAPAALLAGYICEVKKHRYVLIGIMIGVGILIYKQFWIYKKTIPYYQNYFAYITNNKSVDAYRQFFDRQTPKVYDLAEFIRNNTTVSDHVLVLTDSGQIYALSGKLPPGRYIVAYHITFYKDALDEMHNAILEKNPKLIIVDTSDSRVLSLVRNYRLLYELDGSRIYERQY